MNLTPRDRHFAVGRPGQEIRLRHVADVELEPNEQVTFVTGEGKEYDVVRKQWGYYATPSLNGRLVGFGYRSALVESGERRYVLIVERSRMADFTTYLSAQGMRVIAWLDGETIEWVDSHGGR